MNIKSFYCFQKMATNIQLIHPNLNKELHVLPSMYRSELYFIEHDRPSPRKKRSLFVSISIDTLE